MNILITGYSVFIAQDLINQLTLNGISVLARKKIFLPCINPNHYGNVNCYEPLLIITCIVPPQAANQVFFASDNNDISTASMARHTAQEPDKPNRTLPVPLSLYRLAGKVMRKQDMVSRLIDSLQVDITHTKEALDWKSPQSQVEGF